MLEGIKELIMQKCAEHDATKAALKFSTGFIENKYRDGGRVTAREYQEFLAELSKIEKPLLEGKK